MSGSTVVHLKEGEPLYCVARPETPSGLVLVRGDVSTASLAVYDPSSATPSTAVHTKALDPTTLDPTGTTADSYCMFAAEQDDGWWDQEGSYSFFAQLKASEYALEGGKTYTVEVTLAAGHSAPSWPELDDYGPLVLTWYAVVSPAAGT